jgi:hypothetical protein
MAPVTCVAFCIKIIATNARGTDAAFHLISSSLSLLLFALRLLECRVAITLEFVVLHITVTIYGLETCGD